MLTACAQYFGFWDRENYNFLMYNLQKKSYFLRYAVFDRRLGIV